ncbi:MAG: chorismate synthase [Vampirovibrionales bacterium]
MMMRFLTAGESHGPGLTIMVDGFPAGVPVEAEVINHELKRRQGGYGRGGRMVIETDTVKFFGGVRQKHSTGAPVAMFIENRDYKNWIPVMDPQGDVDAEGAQSKRFIRPRPGHADLAGYYKYGHDELRDVLERASARETAARVAAGGLARCLLNALGIQVVGYVASLGTTRFPEPDLLQTTPHAITERCESNNLRAFTEDEALLQQVRDTIDATRKAGDTLGGEVVAVVYGCPPGLGSYTQWDRKLDGQLAQAVMSIQAIKAVAIGEGALAAETLGSQFHDEIRLNDVAHIYRPTNRAGGLEGGVTNGAPLVVRATMKPIATLLKALTSVNLETTQEEQAHFERSDVTAVPACASIVEAMTCYIVANAVLEKFGADSLTEIKRNMAHYLEALKPPTV